MPAIDVEDICTLLSVWDMAASLRFYCDLLGFKIESRSPTYAIQNGDELFHWCLLRAGDSKIMLNTEYDEAERPAERPARGEDRFGVWFFYGCSDLDGAHEKLKAAGIECEPPKLARYGFRVLSFRDPDGRGITLQWPAAQAE